MFHPVPPVAVEVSVDYGDPLFAGTNLTLICSMDLDEDIVDIPVAVIANWMKNYVPVITDSTHSKQQPFVANSTLVNYIATYSFTPLDDKFNNTDSSDMGDSGAYQCELIVMPNVTDSFVKSRNGSNTSNEITILGELDIHTCRDFL